MIQILTFCDSTKLLMYLQMKVAEILPNISIQARAKRGLLDFPSNAYARRWTVGGWVKMKSCARVQDQNSPKKVPIEARSASYQPQVLSQRLLTARFLNFTQPLPQLSHFCQNNEIWVRKHL